MCKSSYQKKCTKWYREQAVKLEHLDGRHSFTYIIDGKLLKNKHVKATFTTFSNVVYILYACVFKLILFENYLKQLEKVVPFWDSKVPFLLNANLMF